MSVSARQAPAAARFAARPISLGFKLASPGIFLAATLGLALLHTSGSAFAQAGSALFPAPAGDYSGLSGVAGILSGDGGGPPPFPAPPGSDVIPIADDSSGDDMWGYFPGSSGDPWDDVPEAGSGWLWGYPSQVPVFGEISPCDDDALFSVFWCSHDLDLFTPANSVRTPLGYVLVDPPPPDPPPPPTQTSTGGAKSDVVPITGDSSGDTIMNPDLPAMTPTSTTSTGSQSLPGNASTPSMGTGTPSTTSVPATGGAPATTAVPANAGTGATTSMHGDKGPLLDDAIRNVGSRTGGTNASTGGQLLPGNSTTAGTGGNKASLLDDAVRDVRSRAGGNNTGGAHSRDALVDRTTKDVLGNQHVSRTTSHGSDVRDRGALLDNNRAIGAKTLAHQTGGNASGLGGTNSLTGPGHSGGNSFTPHGPASMFSTPGMHSGAPMLGSGPRSAPMMKRHF